MDDALLVGVREGRGDRGDRGDDLARAQPPAAGQQRREAAAVQQVQDQRDPRRAPTARLVDDLEQPDQVRMVELAEQRRLARLPLRVAVDEHLHRNRLAATRGTARQTSPEPPRPSSTSRVYPGTTGGTPLAARRAVRHRT